MGVRIDAGQLLRENVPPGFLKDLKDAIVEAYRYAEKVCADRHFPEEVKNLLPFERRAAVQKALKDVAIRHGLKYESAPAGYFWYVARVFVGNLVLDAAHVSSRLAMVRHSDYRETAAEGNQLVFEFMEQAKPLDGNLVYGIVLHGEDSARPAELAFLDIAFPEHTMKAYADHVDILAMFRNAVTIKPVAPVEAEDDLVKLKEQGKTGKKQA
ncbi:MAG: hypothetical protein ACOY93_08415 [Bacillota bacterium]